MRALGLAVACWLLASLPQSVMAQVLAPAEPPADRFEAGVHYQTLLIPVDTATGDNVEVVEVFSYACIHCFNFDSSVEAWSGELREGVTFRRMPAIFNETWGYLAQAYYAAEALEVLDRVHQPLFEAIHVQGVDVRDRKVLAALFETEAGVDNETFIKVFDSMGVVTRVQQADARGRMYHVTGVPTMVVNGKYRVDSRMAGDNTRMLQVVDYLVDQELSNSGGESLADRGEQ